MKFSFKKLSKIAFLPEIQGVCYFFAIIYQVGTSFKEFRICFTFSKNTPKRIALYGN